MSHILYATSVTYDTQVTREEKLMILGAQLASSKLRVLWETKFKRTSTHMSIIRYQPPQTLAFSGFDRLSNLRDELDTLFEMPFWSSLGRQSQLFSGWSPALDLYQNNDNVV